MTIRGSGRSRVAPGECGSVTAEFATALPAVVLLLAVVLAVGSAARTQVQCLDAASAAARLASRGESPARVVEAARHAGPPGVSVAVTSRGDDVAVTVRAPVTFRLPGAPAYVATATAVTPREPSE